jgi:hypothetical protein
MSKPNIGGGESSNEEDMQNSSKTLIEYSPFNNRKSSITNKFSSKSTNIFVTSSNMNENVSNIIEALKSDSQIKSVNNTNKKNEEKRPPLAQQNTNMNNKKNMDILLDDSNKNNVYSFSSRPKPVNKVAINLNNTKSPSSMQTNSSKAYDYRKYIANTTIDTKDANLNAKLTPELFNVSKTVTINESVLTDSLNNTDLPDAKNQSIVYDDVMDSFEANMLRELKAEMESNSTQSTNSKNSSKKRSDSPHICNNNKFINIENAAEKIQQNTNTKNEFNFNKTTLDDGETAQRGTSSGMQTPLSDDYNHTTSEKYNFDAITSSIDETTTSISKKTVKILLFTNNYFLLITLILIFLAK